jgi:hypothetical protein
MLAPSLVQQQKESSHGCTGTGSWVLSIVAEEGVNDCVRRVLGAAVDPRRLAKHLHRGL